MELFKLLTVDHTQSHKPAHNLVFTKGKDPKASIFGLFDELNHKELGNFTPKLSKNFVEFNESKNHPEIQNQNN